MRHRRFGRGVAAVCVSLSGVATVTVADTLVPHEIRITGTGAFETTPTLAADSEGRYVVYTSRDFTTSPVPSGVIYYQRFDAGGLVGAAVQASFGGTDDQLNDANGDLIVYTSYSSPSSDLGEIKLYQVSTGNTSIITELGQILEARIHGHRVAWVERSLALGPRELALEELAAAADGAEGVAGDDEGRGVRCHPVSAAGPDLVEE